MLVSVLSPKKSRLHSARIIAVPTKVLTKYDQQAFLLKICRHHLIFMLLQCTRLFATNLAFPCDHQNLLGKYCVKFLFMLVTVLHRSGKIYTCHVKGCMSYSCLKECTTQVSSNCYRMKLVTNNDTSQLVCKGGPACGQSFNDGAFSCARTDASYTTLNFFVSASSLTTTQRCHKTLFL